MKVKDFYQAGQGIETDPMKRMHPALRQRLEEGDVFFDVHSHCFTYKNVPDEFLGVRLNLSPLLLEWVIWALKTYDKIPFIGEGRLDDFLAVLNNETAEDVVNVLNDTCRAALAKMYDSPPHFISVQLMMDLERGIKGGAKTPYYDQLDELRRLQLKHPAGVLPFIAIDPRNPNYLTDFLSAFDKEDYGAHPFGECWFYGVKIYPSLGYYPSDERLMRVFKICEEKRIPVTTHCSGARVRSSDKKLEINKLVFEGKNLRRVRQTEHFKNEAAFRELNAPEHWYPVLKRYPRLKLNIAHFGGYNEWQKYMNKESGWTSTILEMMHRYEGVYTDVSYTYFSPDFVRELNELCDEIPLLNERVLFGSDFYMVELEGETRNLLEQFLELTNPVKARFFTDRNPRRFLFGQAEDPALQTKQENGKKILA